MTPALSVHLHPWACLTARGCSIRFTQQGFSAPDPGLNVPLRPFQELPPRTHVREHTHEGTEVYRRQAHKWADPPVMVLEWVTRESEIAAESDVFIQILTFVRQHLHTPSCRGCRHLRHTRSLAMGGRFGESIC